MSTIVMAPPARVPLALKLAFTAFMAVMVPFYWITYGPTNKKAYELGTIEAGYAKRLPSHPDNAAAVLPPGIVISTPKVRVPTLTNNSPRAFWTL